MSDKVVIRADGLSKRYRLGQIGGRRLVDDVNRWFARLRGRPDPLSKIGPASLSRGVPASADDPRSPNGGTIWALRDVSFEVAQGEVLGIIGRNGAGKSTALKILSRVVAPTAGQVRIRGRIASLLEVGTGFHPELTGRENIYLNGAILGMTKAEIRSRFDEIVAFSEVEQFIDTPIKRYSSGMHVRLAFAVAAHLEPEILIVDEVLAVGDAEFQKKCLGKMQDVAGHGRTVLFVSHNMGAIEYLCTRAILLDHGRIAESGSAAEVVQKYLAFTTGLARVLLGDRKDRRGSGGIRINSIEVLNEGGQPVRHVAAGQRVIVRLHYICQKGCVFRECRVWVGVEKEGHSYFTLASEVVDRRRLDLNGGGYFDFIIPELPLTAGEYVLNYFVDSQGVIQDTLSAALPLSVVDGNFYGTGQDCPRALAGRYVLVKFHWRLGRDGEAVPPDRAD